MPIEKLILQFGFLVAVVAMYVWQIRIRRGDRRVRQAMNERGHKPSGRPPRPIGERLFQSFLIAIAVAGGGVWLWLEPRIGKLRAASIGMGGCIVLVFLFSYAWLRLRRDPVAGAAAALAKAGDRDGAIAKLEETMNREPTAQRAATLGSLLSQAARYGEAAEAFGRAEALDRYTAAYSVGRVLMMVKAGPAEAALSRIEELRAAAPQDGGFALASAIVLMELDREDEAREQMRQGEELYRAFYQQQRVDRVTTGSLITQLREKLGRSGRGFEVKVAGSSGAAATPDPNASANG